MLAVTRPTGGDYQKRRMTNPADNPLLCSRCGTEVQPDDDFCPDCGELFLENIACSVHPTEPAAGVCVICAAPFCSTCGGRVQDLFLCHDHDTLRISEGMARVFRSGEATEAVSAKTALEEAGLHPRLFSRKASPISIDGVDVNLFPAPGESGRHTVDAFTVMVPCQEFIAAEKKLREEEFIK